jgi:hypothetical protein
LKRTIADRSRLGSSTFAAPQRVVCDDEPAPRASAGRWPVVLGVVPLSAAR